MVYKVDGDREKVDVFFFKMQMSYLTSENAGCKPETHLDTKGFISSASNLACRQKNSGGMNKDSINSSSESQFGSSLYMDSNSQTKSSLTQNLQKVDLVTVSSANPPSYTCPMHRSMQNTNSEQLVSVSSGRSSNTSPCMKMNGAMSCQLVINHGRLSSNSTHSDSLESSPAPLKPHTGGDVRWDAINSVSLKDSPIGLSNFRLLKRLGYGDIGSVYLVELRGTSTYFAMKVMDKGSLASRNKLLRAQTEREILGLLDHPFLPTLYSYFETEKYYCLVMEFCSGGNLHTLRQKQPNKHFSEDAAR